MKVARFEHFVNAVERNFGSNGSNHSPRVYRIFKSKWFDEIGADINDANLIADLETVLTHSANHWRGSGRVNTHCYFRVPDLNAVLRLEFQMSPSTKTQKQFADKVGDCYSNSSNEFIATHDTLTELLNRPAFELELDVAIELANKPLEKHKTDPYPTPISSHESSSGFMLLAFDLDHFKQVNDSHGHQYGDIVLQAFAWRLSDAVEYLAKENNLHATVSRFGGEEFYVLLEGTSDSLSCVRFAEELREKLTTDVLPDEEQWEVLSTEKGIKSSVKLPHPADRKLTASIGLTTFSGVAQGSDFKRIKAKLLKEADTALYRAKADGRNCCRPFQGIRDQYGRVLEHHREANIVVVDIGENVGVQVGQEYLVYHPQFSGGTPFYHSDGRTKRRLGEYPQKSCGRISVFSVSPEISFCTVSENQLLVLFPVGSRLEYIPIGSIASHLGEIPAGAAPQLISMTDLKSRLTDRFIEGQEFVVCAFSINGLEELAAEKGVSYANQVLVLVFKAIQEHLPKCHFISQDKIGKDFAFIAMLHISLERIDAEKMLKKILEKFPRTLTINAGAYCEEDDAQVDAYAIDLAKIATQTERTATAYSETTFLEALIYLRGKDRSAAISVFEQIIALGVPVTGMLFNIAGLCYLDMGEASYSEACKHFERAIELEPDNVQCQLNLGYTEHLRGDYRRAYSIMRKQHQAIIDMRSGFFGYLISYAEAGFWCLERDTDALIRAEANRGEIAIAISKALKDVSIEKWVHGERLQQLRDFDNSQYGDLV